MATIAHDFEMQLEPSIRTITIDVPNLRNAAVAAEYKRQRAVIFAASEGRRAETEFWESVQTDEGWA